MDAAMFGDTSHPAPEETSLQQGTQREMLLFTVSMIGISLCSLALYSIAKTKSMQNSFGSIVASQMTADILKLSITTAFCVIPADMAPPEDATISKIIGACCETLYFFACDLHTLFAIHRFILVVFPSAKGSWSRLTPFAILFCFCTGTFKAFYLMALDPNLYLRYDRNLMQWMFTATPWTRFYKYSKICWSSVENTLIFILDLISFRKLRAMLKMAANDTQNFAHEYSNADTKLVVQCIPTTLVIIFYFYIYPAMTDEFLMFATSTLMWNLATMCDGLVVVVFHTRMEIFRVRGDVESIGASTTLPSGQESVHPIDVHEQEQELLDERAVQDLDEDQSDEEVEEVAPAPPEVWLPAKASVRAKPLAPHLPSILDLFDDAYYEGALRAAKFHCTERIRRGVAAEGPIPQSELVVALFPSRKMQKPRSALELQSLSAGMTFRECTMDQLQRLANGEHFQHAQVPADLPIARSDQDAPSRQGDRTAVLDREPIYCIRPPVRDGVTPILYCVLQTTLPIILLEVVDPLVHLDGAEYLRVLKINRQVSVDVASGWVGCHMERVAQGDLVWVYKVEPTPGTVRAISKTGERWKSIMAKYAKEEYLDAIDDGKSPPTAFQVLEFALVQPHAPMESRLAWVEPFNVKVSGPRTNRHVVVEGITSMKGRCVEQDINRLRDRTVKGVVQVSIRPPAVALPLFSAPLKDPSTAGAVIAELGRLSLMPHRIGHGPLRPPPQSVIAFLTWCYTAETCEIGDDGWKTGPEVRRLGATIEATEARELWDAAPHEDLRLRIAKNTRTEVFGTLELVRKSVKEQECGWMRGMFALMRTAHGDWVRGGIANTELHTIRTGAEVAYYLRVWLTFAADSICAQNIKPGTKVQLRVVLLDTASEQRSPVHDELLGWPAHFAPRSAGKALLSDMYRARTGRDTVMHESTMNEGEVLGIGSELDSEDSEEEEEDGKKDVSGDANEMKNVKVEKDTTAEEKKDEEDFQNRETVGRSEIITNTERGNQKRTYADVAADIKKGIVDGTKADNNVGSKNEDRKASEKMKVGVRKTSKKEEQKKAELKQKAKKNRNKKQERNKIKKEEEETLAKETRNEEMKGVTDGKKEKVDDVMNDEKNQIDEEDKKDPTIQEEATTSTIVEETPKEDENKKKDGVINVEENRVDEEDKKDPTIQEEATGEASTIVEETPKEDENKKNDDVMNVEENRVDEEDKKDPTIQEEDTGEASTIVEETPKEDENKKNDDVMNVEENRVDEEDKKDPTIQEEDTGEASTIVEETPKEDENKKKDDDEENRSLKEEKREDGVQNEKEDENQVTVEKREDDTREDNKEMKVDGMTAHNKEKVDVDRAEVDKHVGSKNEENESEKMNVGKTSKKEERLKQKKAEKNRKKKEERSKKKKEEEDRMANKGNEKVKEDGKKQKTDDVKNKEENRDSKSSDVPKNNEPEMQEEATTLEEEDEKLKDKEDRRNLKEARRMDPLHGVPTHCGEGASRIVWDREQRVIMAAGAKRDVPILNVVATAGSGKTTVTAAAIEHSLRVNGPTRTVIIFVAVTNSATGVAAAKCRAICDRAIARVLRVSAAPLGRHPTAADLMERIAACAKDEAAPGKLRAHGVTLRAALDELQRLMRGHTHVTSMTATDSDRVAALHKTIARTRAAATPALLAYQKPNVLVMTLDTLILTMNRPKSPVKRLINQAKQLFVWADEASQMPELAVSAIAKLLPHAPQRYVGDPSQLPPFSRSRGSDAALFGRLLAGEGVSTALAYARDVPRLCLSECRRMHPALLPIPSDLFYRGRMTTRLQPADREPPATGLLDADFPLTVITTDGDEQSAPTGSMWNPNQEEVAQKVAEHLRARILEETDTIAILSLYREPVRRLSRTVNGNITISTVDSSQGDEFDVTIVLTTRSYAGGQLKHVQDARRINVALTRAKRAIIVIGNVAVLRKALYWKEIYAEAESMNTVIRDSDVEKIFRQE